MERVKGTIIELIYYNEENCYAVIGVENPEMDFVAVGYLPNAEKGRTFVFEGTWKNHATYGEQFSFTAFTEEMPSTAAGIEAFLSSGLLKGIGKKTAALIVNRFGEDTLKIIETDPMRLMEISGIGEAKATAVAEAYKAHREFAQITVYFQQYGISPSYAMKLYKVYGSDTIRAVEENPYQLVDDIFGVGFKKADAIAEKLGIAKDSEFRIRSGIEYALWAYTGEGHTFIPQKLFCEKTAEFLDIAANDIYEMTVQMAFEGDVHLETLEGRSVIFPIALWKAEQNVCAKLMELNDAPLSHIATDEEMERLISSIQSETGLELSEGQRFAVSSSLKNGVSVITGGPGTGKTTILNTIMRIFQRVGINAAIAAPTGRAAKRISETSGYPASTIHRLLEYYYSEGEDAMRFGKTAEDPLEYEAVIIDEASMVDILLMNGLVSAIRPGTRLIIVGDADQLPSVGAGNVLRDIIDSEVIYSVKLTEIFRQARESMIVVNAHRNNSGDYPDVNAKGKDFFLLRTDNEKEMLATIKDLNIRRLPNFYTECDPVRDIQVMTPVRKGFLGTHQLNQELQAILNPPSQEKRERKHGERTFREGDKIMQIKNNYQLTWRRLDDLMEGQGIFNGDVGFIQSIDTENGFLYALFDDNKYVCYEFGQLDEVELAYAITVHKSQGSEFPIIIMPVTWFPPMLATRNLLYTAVTRAKKAVVLVGSEARMNNMVDNNRIVERYSGLAERLRNYMIMEI